MGRPPTPGVTVTVVLRSIIAAMAICLFVATAPHAAAQSAAPPWAACGVSSPESKPVRTFPVRPPVGGPSRTFATLLCGNDRYGFRHLAVRHASDWEALSFYTGGNWRDIADFAMAQSLTVPQPGYPLYNPKNDSWTYKSPLEIKDANGNVRTTYWPLVAVAAQDGKILTSYPTRDPK